RSFREVGEALGVAVEAAKKRVRRVLEKLRNKLARRTVNITGITLATIMTAKTAQAAPVAVVSGALHAGLQAGGLAAPTALALAAGVARDWFLTRLKWGLGILGVASLLLFTV